MDESGLAQARVKTKAGDLWTIKRLGLDWPAIICDEFMIQQFFTDERPPSARQADCT